jgi:hypothetical protein
VFLLIARPTRPNDDDARLSGTTLVIPREADEYMCVLGVKWKNKVTTLSKNSQLFISRKRINTQSVYANRDEIHLGWESSLFFFFFFFFGFENHRRRVARVHRRVCFVHDFWMRDFSLFYTQRVTRIFFL